jgi:hypothetical protein
MVDSSRISQRNVSFNNDLNDSSHSIERLKTWTPRQNFTAILNNPQVGIKIITLSNLTSIHILRT